MTILDPPAKKQPQTQRRPDMLQKAKVNVLERKANMKRASLTKLGRVTDLAKDCGFSSLTVVKRLIIQYWDSEHGQLA